MPDNHPQINLDQAPSLVCANPVYNCIPYCFTATDFIVDPGNAANFSVIFLPPNKSDGLPVIVAGQNFSTGTPTTFEQFQAQDAPPLSNDEIAANFLQMLQSSYSLPSIYNFTQLAFPFDFVVVAVAKQVGEQENFIFDFSALSPAAPFVIDNNGTNKELLPNYVLIVEIWLCDGPNLLERISQKAYRPDENSGEVCIDISANVRALVETTFPDLVADSNTIVQDETIEQEICLRYGQGYTEPGADCDILLRHFEPSSPIRIINSAFQKDDDDKFAPFCYDLQGSDTRFMSNKPQGYELCADSYAWYWYNYQAQDIADGVTGTATVLYLFEYTTGTPQFVFGDTLLNGNGVYIIPYGLAQIGYLADPLRTVVNVRMSVVIVSASPQIVISEVIDNPIDLNCCAVKEFYFLNAVGGYDTILLNSYEDIDLDISSAEFIGYEECNGELTQGGKASTNIQAFETYTCFMKYTDEYLNRNWLREFLLSPIKYVRGEDGKVRKIRVIGEQFPIFRQQERTFIQIQFVYSYSLNVQQI